MKPEAIEKIAAFNSLKISYFTYGNGSKTLITLHGFGRSYKDFRMFDKQILPKYKVIGINIFHHGNSYFPLSRVKNQPLTKTEWFGIFQKIIDHEGIDTFSIMAYSMGGKFAFCLLEHFGKNVEKIVLLAPDGIKKHWGYRFVTETKLGRFLTRRFILSKLKPQLWLAWLGKFKLVNKKLAQFVAHNSDGIKTRFLVYKTWQSFVLINPNHNQIKYQINKAKFTVILGLYDQAIKAKYQKKLEKLYSNQVEVKIVSLGHQLFKDVTKPLIEEALK